jgi:hypothetical protein
MMSNDPRNVPHSDIFELPGQWMTVSQDDRREYLRLRTLFTDQGRQHSKDRRSVSFSQDMLRILRFIERSPIGGEQRSILVGVAFAGPYICVHTRQLKLLIARCKSSININFQNLGYVSVKSKHSQWIAAILPSLSRDIGLLRQWTVREASPNAQFCFVGNNRAPFLRAIEVKPKLPMISEVQSMPIPMIGFRTAEFDLAPLKELEMM